MFPVGNIVYSQWLNDAGGIEADVTITRLDSQSYMVVSGCASERRDLFWLRRHGSSFQCTITQTHDTAIIGVMGPRST
jgi:4-methylaminobutanoate oxidase (formaldehyde-forming)